MSKLWGEGQAEVAPFSHPGAIATDDRPAAVPGNTVHITKYHITSGQQGQQHKTSVDPGARACLVVQQNERQTSAAIQPWTSPLDDPPGASGQFPPT